MYGTNQGRAKVDMRMQFSYFLGKGTTDANPLPL